MSTLPDAAHASESDSASVSPPISGFVPELFLRRFGKAVEQHDGAALAALFATDGIYYDCFHGAFTGRVAIAALIDDWFYRTARDFRWTFHDPVFDGATLYARYAFSYRSNLERAPDGRVGFEGVSIMRIGDGLIREYREVAHTGPVLAALNFAPERIAAVMAKHNRQVWASSAFSAHREIEGGDLLETPAP